MLIGRVQGRRNAEEITLLKSLGIAVEDLAAAHYVLEQASARNRRVFVDIGGRHFGSG